jgi:hypothetical protein
MTVQSKNKIDSQHLQEMMESAGSSALGGRASRGLCQYETPQSLADYVIKQLSVYGEPNSVYDPQCFTGNLLNFSGWGTHRFGIDMDKRLLKVNDNVHRLIGDCVDITKDILTLKPDLRFECSVANPPFSLNWEGKDSTLWTWEHVTQVSNRGAFIANANTIRRLKIDQHPYAYDFEVRPFPGVSVNVGIVYWMNDADPTVTTVPEILKVWNTMETIQKEKRKGIPSHNIWFEHGVIRAYLSTFEKQTRNLTRARIVQLLSLDGKRPETLAVERTIRMLLKDLITSKFYTMSPEAEIALSRALKEAENMAIPIMAPTDFALVAWAGEEQELTCHTSRYGFRKGQSYKVGSGTYRFVSRFTRKKQHLDSDGTSYTKSHACSLSGIDSQIQVSDGEITHIFRQLDHAKDTEHPDYELFEIFNRPVVQTIDQVMPEAYQYYRDLLTQVEALGNFAYYPGQADYIARNAIKDFAFICAETGVGKTLIFISLLALKPYERALIIAPQATIKGGNDEHSASQWIEEIEKFAPHITVHQLFSFEDYYRLLRKNDGVLPAGVYISYYEAMFQNGAIEKLPPNMTCGEYLKLFGIKYDPESEAQRQHWERVSNPLAEGAYKPVGHAVRGIRSIVKPSLGTLVADEFDLVGFDEGHTVKNHESITGSAAIRMRAKYRYMFSATPIPNTVEDLFATCGWLAVPDWFNGNECNAVWPYRMIDLNDFAKDYRCIERDYTQEQMNVAANPKRKSPVTKKSAVISNPATLIKLTRPFVAYIDKPTCNPAYRRPNIMDVRVPMSCEQNEIYEKYLDLRAFTHKNHMVKRSLQISTLRAVTTDPSEFGVNPITPKVLAVMSLIEQILAKGEQVLHVSARLSLNNTVARLLDECRIPFSRVDSSLAPSQHAQQIQSFKRKESRVQLMGIKCAQGHSYPECENEIISSLEWTNGSLEQAIGRPDRLNSPTPPNIYVILHHDTIEDYIFDTVATKEDAAKIVLKGQRLPRDYKTTDLAEVVAEAQAFTGRDVIDTQECLDQWASLRKQLRCLS